MHYTLNIDRLHAAAIERDTKQTYYALNTLFNICFVRR